VPVREAYLERLTSQGGFVWNYRRGLRVRKPDPLRPNGGAARETDRQAEGGI